MAFSLSLSLSNGHSPIHKGQTLLASIGHWLIYLHSAGALTHFHTQSRRRLDDCLRRRSVFAPSLHLLPPTSADGERLPLNSSNPIKDMCLIQRCIDNFSIDSSRQSSGGLVDDICPAVPIPSPSHSVWVNMAHPAAVDFRRSIVSVLQCRGLLRQAVVGHRMPLHHIVCWSNLPKHIHAHLSLCTLTLPVPKMCSDSINRRNIH